MDGWLGGCFGSLADRWLMSIGTPSSTIATLEILYTQYQCYGWNACFLNLIAFFARQKLLGQPASRIKQVMNDNQLLDKKVNVKDMSQLTYSEYVIQMQLIPHLKKVF